MFKDDQSLNLPSSRTLMFNRKAKDLSIPKGDQLCAAFVFTVRIPDVEGLVVETDCAPAGDVDESFH